jgi:DNA helicase II / ATP-dependent DNA helicase PcrA
MASCEEELIYKGKLMNQTTILPTPEQTEIIDKVKDEAGNLQINAYAGTGKTATLELIQSVHKGPTLCLAFNRAVANEMEKRFGPSTTVRTLNGLGHRVWSQTCAGRVSLDPRKIQDLLREEIKKLSKEEKEEAWESFWEIVQFIGLAKSLGYVPEGSYAGAKRLATWADLVEWSDWRPSQSLVDSILLASIRQAYAGLLDYNDQIYMPALFGGTFPKFPLVLVDEAQDLSPTNHQMLHRLKGGRIISVGDPFQSVYQFRGACQDGMGKLARAFYMTELPLSVSWRCPSEIVKNARWRVPEFKWNRMGGRVDRLERCEAMVIPNGSSIICRNNAPLLRLAINLISLGRSVSVAGSDIGPKLVGVMRRFGDDNLPRSAVLGEIADWAARKTASGNKTADDLAACMEVFAQRGKDLGQAIAFAEDVLKRKGSIYLSTGHKAKGMEWETVYHLDPWLIGKDEQELNLRYVIQTRAKENYFEIDSRSIQNA